MPEKLAPGAERLAVALDVADRARLTALCRALRGRVGVFKVGLELYTALGPEAIELVVSEGGPVFLDLKLHDIPNTVAAAVRQAARREVALLTVHCAGGTEMLKAAVAAAAESPRPPKLLGVTVLTSLQAADLDQIGLSGPVPAAVLRLAGLAQGAGLGGLVTSPEEVQALRAALGPGPLLVVPGIRPEGAERGDQRRVATPAEAIRRGASLLVVGRPITAAADPAAAADAIAAEIAGALA